MPRHKKFQLSAEETTRIRQTLDAWLAGQGYDDAGLARQLGVKPETVKLNLGRADYKTQRPLSDDFLVRVQRLSGLTLVSQPELLRPALRPRSTPAAADQVVLFLARAVIATASQLGLLLGQNRTQFNRLAQALIAQKLLEREREAAPPSGLARSRQYIYGLSAQGRSRAQKSLGFAPQLAFSRGRLRGSLFVSHDLLVSEAALRIKLGLQDRLGDWFTSADCRDEFKGPQGRAAIEPDLVFVVDLPGGPGCGWLEVETGSGGRRSVVEKARAIEQYYLSGAFRRRWKTERLTVFWIGEADDHSQQLRDWVGPGRPRLMHKFTSWEWIQQLGLAGPIWLRLYGGPARHPLLALPADMTTDSPSVSAAPGAAPTPPAQEFKET